MGRVSLLPGTCYIEIARAVVRDQHGSTAFALPNVRFQSIMFLDEAALRGAPLVRMRLELGAANLTITSRVEGGAWFGRAARSA